MDDFTATDLSNADLTGNDLGARGGYGGHALNGGGKVRGAAANPVYGRDRVVRLIMYFMERLRKLGVHAERTDVNGQPGAVMLDDEGRVFNVFALDIADDGAVQAVRSIVNPDKLHHLGPLMPREAPGHAGERT